MAFSEKERRFVEWWTKIEQRLLSFGRRLLGSPDLAQELAQDLALVALDQFDHFSSQDHFEAFLLTRARWLAIDRLRRNAKHARLLQQFLTEDSYFESYEANSDLSVFFQACNELPKRQRAVLVRSLLGFSVDEIARELGIAPPTVRSLRRFAKLQLSRTMRSLDE